MSKILLNNQPSMSVHEVDKNFNERRANLIPYIKDYICNNKLFKDEEVSITFINSGVSSLVCILETSDKKLVLKIPLSKTFSNGEGQFLKVWEKAGISVPHVIEEGIVNEHSYILYDYIEAKTLGETYICEELIEKKTFIDIGNAMRLMHVPKAEGFGRVIDGKAEYSKFKDWIFGPDIEERVKYVTEHRLLGEEHGSLPLAFETLIAFINANNESSYCHEDVTTYNIFDTKPLTFFDPNPRFNNGYIDLARCIYGTIWHGEPDEVRSQLIQGYFKGEAYNTHALQAAILLYSYIKFPYAHKTKKDQNIKNVQNNLIKPGTL